MIYRGSRTVETMSSEAFSRVPHFLWQINSRQGRLGQPATETMTDLKLAPCDKRGSVNFWSDFRIRQPVGPWRGSPLDILNGEKASVLINSDAPPVVTPEATSDPGGGVFMQQSAPLSFPRIHIRGT